MGFFRDLFLSSSETNIPGLCLSGGAALGLAHIGVLQALEDHGIFPEHVVGSSMGAIIGTLYCAGYSPAEMMHMIKNDKLYKITKLMNFHPAFLKSGLSNHNMLRSLIKELIPHNSFEQLKKHMHICVVNLTKSEWEIIHTGNELDMWVAASASIPGLFEAIKYEDNFYVDGGLLNNMPAQGLEDYCQTIIGVDVIPHRIPESLSKPIDTIAYSVRAVQHQNSKEGREMCRFLIESNAIDKHNEFSFDAFQDIYQHGYSAATKYIVENPEMMMLKNSYNKSVL